MYLTGFVPAKAALATDRHPTNNYLPVEHPLLFDFLFSMKFNSVKLYNTQAAQARNRHIEHMMVPFVVVVVVAAVGLCCNNARCVGLSRLHIEWKNEHWMRRACISCCCCLVLIGYSSQRFVNGSFN